MFLQRWFDEARDADLRINVAEPGLRKVLHEKFLLLDGTERALLEDQAELNRMRNKQKKAAAQQRAATAH